MGLQVMANKEQKEVLFPPDATTLKAEYKKTDSGLFFKIVKEGEGDIVPQPGDTLEINYIGSVCEVDKDGSYDCAPRQGLAEIYPTMPQVNSTLHSRDGSGNSAHHLLRVLVFCHGYDDGQFCGCGSA